MRKGLEPLPLTDAHVTAGRACVKEEREERGGKPAGAETGRASPGTRMSWSAQRGAAGESGMKRGGETGATLERTTIRRMGPRYSAAWSRPKAARGARGGITWSGFTWRPRGSLCVAHQCRCTSHAR
jgi:hypothetical protein